MVMMVLEVRYKLSDNKNGSTHNMDNRIKNKNISRG